MIIILLVSILAGLAAVLFFLHRHHRAITERLDRVPVNNEEMLKDVVREENAATRLHVSQAVDGIKHDTDVTKMRITDYIGREKIDANEIRGQLTILKERVQSMISTIDELTRRVIAFTNKIIEWIAVNKDKQP